MKSPISPFVDNNKIAQRTCKALSIRQPWAWLIVKGLKEIENRAWNTTYRGDFYIHASKNLSDYDDCVRFVDKLNNDPNAAIPHITLPAKDDLQLGGIIGAAYLSQCVTTSDSPWFTGEYGFILHNPRILPFFPCKGKLGFFHPDFDQNAA